MNLPADQKHLYKRMKHALKHMPESLSDAVLVEVRGYLVEFQTVATQDFSAEGLRPLAKALGRISAYRSRVAAVLIGAGNREAIADGLKQRADYVFAAVRSQAAASDAVIGISRADLRKEKIFELSQPFAQVAMRVKSRLLLLQSQSSALRLALGELDALQKNISRQVTAIQVDLSVNRGA